MFCSNCGSPIREGGKFCPDCGAKIVPLNTAAGKGEPPVDENVNVNVNGTDVAPVQEEQRTAEPMSMNEETVPVSDEVPEETVTPDVQPISQDRTAGIAENLVPETPVSEKVIEENNEIPPVSSNSGSYQAMPVQPSSGSYQATPVQPSSGSYQATPVQASSGSYQATPVQPSAGSNQTTSVQTATDASQSGSAQAQGNNHYINNVSSQNPSASHMNTVNPKSSGIPTAVPVSPAPKKKSKMGLILGLVIALLVVVGAVAAVFILKPFGGKDPFERLMMANHNLLQGKQISLSTEFSVDLDEENSDLVEMISQAGLPFQSTDEDVLAYLAAVIEKYTIQYNTAFDLKGENLKMGVEGKLLYNDQDLFDARLNVQPWEASVSSKLLMSKPLHMDVSKYISDMTGFDVSKVEIKPYLDILLEEDEFYKSFPKSETAKLLKERLGGKGKDANLKKIGKEKIKINGKTINTDKIRLEITYREAMELSNDMFFTMTEDPKFKKSFLDKAEKLMQKILEMEDYKLFGMDEETFTDTMEETLSQLDSSYDDIMENFRDGLKESQEMMEEVDTGLLDQTIVYDFYLVKNELKRISFSADNNGIAANVNVNILPFDDDILDIPSAKDSFNAEELMMGNSQEFFEDVISNIEKNILKDDAFNEMLEDFKEEAKENLIPEDAEMVETIIETQLENILANFKYLLP